MVDPIFGGTAVQAVFVLPEESAQADLQAGVDDRREQPRGPCGVLAEQNECALVECGQRLAVRMNAAPTPRMRQRRVGKVQNSPSSLHQASAEIRIFPIKEEAFVHPADLVESGPAYEH